MLVIGTANRKKGHELADLFKNVGVELKTLADFPGVVSVPEDGDTFAANAVLKAAGYARQLHRWVLADDSGLLVDALNGEPGVLSARFTGEDASDEDNNRLVLKRLGDTPIEKRTAQFVCHMALSDPEGAIQAESEAACRGRILFSPGRRRRFRLRSVVRNRRISSLVRRIRPAGKSLPEPPRPGGKDADSDG